MGQDCGRFANQCHELPGSGHAVLERSVTDTTGSNLAAPQGWLPLCGTPDNVQDPTLSGPAGYPRGRDWQQFPS
jgi:hypothetical protein